MTDNKPADNQWIQSYALEMGDKLKIGFELLKCREIELAERDKFDIDAHLAWLATVFANKFLDYALTNPKDRPKMIELKHQPAEVVDVEKDKE